MSKAGADTDVRPVVGVKKTADPETPDMYKVILLNDDITPGELVAEILAQVFFLDWMTAQGVMFRAHKHGEAVVGVWTREEADTMIKTAMDRVRGDAFPLQFRIAPDSRGS